MVRQISDLGKAKEFTHGHACSVSQAVSQLGAQRGGYWRGVGPSVLRAVVLNTSMTSPYDYLKERMWITYGEVWPNTLVALVGATILGTVFTLPIDNIKTRLQNQHVNPEVNRLTYRSSFSVISKSIAHEGLNGLFVGMVPYYAKVFAYALVVIAT